MKIAIVATYDVTKNLWAGTASSILNILKKNYNTTPIKISLKRPFINKVKSFYFNNILKKKYYTTFDISVYKYNEKYLDKFFDTKYDLIVTYEYFLVPSISKYGKNTFLITDATFDNLLNYYDYRSNLCSLNIRDGHKLQELAFEKLSCSFLSSAWAILNAKEKYQVPESRLNLLCYGSNLSKSLQEDSLEELIERRFEDNCIKLLFAATSWERKGGEYAISVVKLLNQRGFRAKLIMAGCKPPETVDKTYITYSGYLNKRMPEQEAKFIELYKGAHFLILPSKADCTPIVFSEANSFALPIITTTTGGISSIVNEDNNNGVMFDLDENFVEKAVGYVIAAYGDKEIYKTICKDSYTTYKQKLDWSVAEKLLVKEIKKLEFKSL